MELRPEPDSSIEDTLRLAIVGAGRMGSFHLAALAARDFVDVVAVLDARREVAQGAASSVGAEIFSTLEELAGSPDVDAWLIATPTPTHPDLVSAALSSRIHVLCEKPLSLDAADHDRLGALAEDMGLVLQVGF